MTKVQTNLKIYKIKVLFEKKVKNAKNRRVYRIYPQIYVCLLLLNPQICKCYLEIEIVQALYNTIHPDVINMKSLLKKKK